EEAVAEFLQQFRMSGRVERRQIVGRVDDPSAEVVRPDSVHDRLREVRVVRFPHPLHHQFARVTIVGDGEGLGEPEPLTIADDRDPRELVMEWMRKPDNPYFAKAIVNRVWSHYFGRGIIDPPDNLSAFNPATHPELLKELCDGFL